MFLVETQPNVNGLSFILRKFFSFNKRTVDACFTHAIRLRFQLPFPFCNFILIYFVFILLWTSFILFKVYTNVYQTFKVTLLRFKAILVQQYWLQLVTTNANLFQQQHLRENPNTSLSFYQIITIFLTDALLRGTVLKLSYGLPSYGDIKGTRAAHNCTSLETFIKSTCELQCVLLVSVLSLTYELLHFILLYPDTGRYL